MKERFKKGDAVFLAAFNKNDLTRSGVFQGVVDEDGQGYYIISGAHAGVWTDETVHSSVLDAINQINKEACITVGALMLEVHNLNVLQSKMHELWHKSYNNDGGASLPKA